MKFLSSLLLIVLSFFGCQTASKTILVEKKQNENSGEERAFADLYNTLSGVDNIFIRGRLVNEEPGNIGDLTTTPYDQISQDELKKKSFSVVLDVNGKKETLGKATTDEEGYFDTSFDAKHLSLGKGRYAVEIFVDDKPAGKGFATLIEANRTRPIVRSDVDLTYLLTNFHGKRAMLKLIREEAKEKTALLGMPILYQNLRGDDAHSPITFLSGSPRFFKRTLESKMILDDVEQDGLVLKPFKDIVGRNFFKITFEQIVPDLKEQIGYKLFWLLKLRQQIPPSTPEILMGDDSEADFVVYNIYSRFMTGELKIDALKSELEKVKVSASWISPILEFAKSTALTKTGIPVAIYINHTEVTGESFDIKNWIVPGVTRYHRGAWPLALDLAEEGWITQEHVQEIRAVLLKDLKPADLDRAKAEADFLD